MELITNLLGLGLDPKDLNTVHVVTRSVVIFLAALVFVRLADKRFMAKLSAFDVVLGFIIASMLARAVNGSGPLVPSLVGALVLVLVHRFMARLACRYRVLERLVKGKPRVLICEGVEDQETMKRHAISREDLEQQLRLNGRVGDVRTVRKATLERNGEISILEE